MYMDKEGTTLATEILHELKRSARRWFIAFLVMVGIEIATVGTFVWYLSLSTEESVDIENDESNANYIGNDMKGEEDNGTILYKDVEKITKSN